MGSIEFPTDSKLSLANISYQNWELITSRPIPTAGLKATSKSRITEPIGEISYLS